MSGLFNDARRILIFKLNKINVQGQHASTLPVNFSRGSNGWGGRLWGTLEPHWGLSISIRPCLPCLSNKFRVTDAKVIQSTTDELSSASLVPHVVLHAYQVLWQSR